MKNPSVNPFGRLTTFVISFLYEDVIIFSGEFILSDSEYPKQLKNYLNLQLKTTWILDMEK